MANDFESRRRERRRRERLRKKRIRAAIILIAFIGVIILIIAGISTCARKSQTVSTDNAQLDTTQSPESAIPTLTPSSSMFSIPPASEQNDLLKIIKNSGETKHCYLTFDDGPTTNITPQILDTLRRYNVKATFFQIGSLIKANPDMARRVYEEGHLIANHSNGHNYEKLYVSTETFMNEVNECYEAIKDVTGEAEPFKLVRFPGGGYESKNDSYSPVKQQCKTIMKENGFYYADWDALNGDAEGKTKNAQELLDYCIRTSQGYDNVVILMHDASAKQATADALGSIIEYFMNEGYTFHRLDDIDYQASPSATTASTADDTTASTSSVSATQTPSSSSATTAPSSASTAPSASPSGSSSSATAAPTTQAATQAPQNGQTSSASSSGAFIIGD